MKYYVKYNNANKSCSYGAYCTLDNNEPSCHTLPYLLNTLKASRILSMRWHNKYGRQYHVKIMRGY